MSFTVVHPANAMASSNSSLSICSTFFTPFSPSQASPKTTGLPIWIIEIDQININPGRPEG
jgi:hypothetical protein